MSIAPAIAAIEAAGFTHWVSPCRTVCLVNADCTAGLATLPDDCVDITVTSPPYNIRGGEHQASGMFSVERMGPRKISGEWYDDAMPENAYWRWLNGVVFECRRVARGLVWVNHKVRYEDRQAIHPVRLIDQPCYSEVIWDRGVSITLNARKFAPSHEALWGFGTPHYWNDRANTFMSVWRIKPRVDGEHPCPFPHEIARRPIFASCPPEGVVCDPFTGSGTVAEVAIETGRGFVGFEKSPEYYDLAINRVSAALGMETRGKDGTTQRMMFAPEVSP